MIPLVMLIDSKILFDILTRKRVTRERRTIVNLLANRNAYAELEISNILLIPSDDNPTDALSKLNPNDALHRLVTTNYANHCISLYVIEPDNLNI